MHLNAKVHLNLFRRDDERLQATGAELGDSIFNTTGENWLYMKQLKGYVEEKRCTCCVHLIFVPLLRMSSKHVNHFMCILCGDQLFNQNLRRAAQKSTH